MNGSQTTSLHSPKSTLLIQTTTHEPLTLIMPTLSLLSHLFSPSLFDRSQSFHQMKIPKTIMNFMERLLSPPAGATRCKSECVCLLAHSYHFSS